jgi:hypothetical protein
MSQKDHAKKQKENKNITEPLKKAKEEKTEYQRIHARYVKIKSELKQV